MHLVPLLSLLTLTTATLLPRQTPSIPPNGQTAVQDIQNIHTAVLSLTANTETFTSTTLLTTLVGGVQVLSGVAQIHTVNRLGFLNANLAAPYSASDSADVVHTVTATVAQSIPQAVEVTKAKKAEFERAGFVPTVIASLRLLLDDHDTFSAVVLERLRATVEEEAEGRDGVERIHEAIQGGIDFFSA